MEVFRSGIMLLENLSKASLTLLVVGVSSLFPVETSSLVDTMELLGGSARTKI
jgi:hypothetical protein